MPKASWEESVEDYAARLKQVVEGINNHHYVDARWRSFPTLWRAGLLSILGFWSVE